MSSGLSLESVKLGSGLQDLFLGPCRNLNEENYSRNQGNPTQLFWKVQWNASLCTFILKKNWGFYLHQYVSWNHIWHISLSTLLRMVPLWTYHWYKPPVLTWIEWLMCSWNSDLELEIILKARKRGCKMIDSEVLGGRHLGNLCFPEWV